jgi:hypothetical protein
MGVGLVGFGIGGGFGGGGLFTAATNNEGTNSASFAAEVKKYRKLSAAQPTDAVAWEKLTRALLHEAGGETYVSGSGLTSKGKQLFTQASESWHSYVALNPPNASTQLAKEMLPVYGEEGLNEPTQILQALNLIVAAEPNSYTYNRELALFAYKAKNTRLGDLAAAKAIALAPAEQRARLKTALAEVKKNPNGTSSSSSGTSTTTTGTTSTPSNTITVGGSSTTKTKG